MKVTLKDYFSYCRSKNNTKGMLKSLRGYVNFLCGEGECEYNQSHINTFLSWSKDKDISITGKYEKPKLLIK